MIRCLVAAQRRPGFGKDNERSNPVKAEISSLAVETLLSHFDEARAMLAVSRQQRAVWSPVPWRFFLSRTGQSLMRI